MHIPAFLGRLCRPAGPAAGRSGTGPAPREAATYIMAQAGTESGREDRTQAGTQAGIQAATQAGTESDREDRTQAGTGSGRQASTPDATRPGAPESEDLAAASDLARAIPRSLAGRVRLVGSTFHVSAELRGNMELDVMLARAARLAGGRDVAVEWLSPARFEQRFGLGRQEPADSPAGGTSAGATDHNAPGAEAGTGTAAAGTGIGTEGDVGLSAGSRGADPDRGPDRGPDRETAALHGAWPMSADVDGRSWVDEYVQRLFRRAMARKVTDIHITYMGPYAQVHFRRMGLMLEEECLEGSRGLQLIRGIFQGQLSQAESGFSEYERYDGRIADRNCLPDGLFAVRLHTEPIQSPHIPGPGINLAMRLLFDATRASGTVCQRLASLGFTAQQQELIASFCETTGMSVVSGPTGHGKTTVLKNILEARARDVPTLNYFSLEDPPEYTILGVKQLNVFTKAVSDAERKRALLEALAGLMRSDPDVILLGEIRYLEAANAAVNAALTGHSVWTTVHAGSALNVIARFHEMGLPLASICADGVLSGLTYQRLMPVLCPACRKPLVPHADELAPRLVQRLKALYPHGEPDAMFLRGPGCPHCDGLGLVGLKVAAEVIALKDRKLLDLLRHGNILAARRHWVHELGGRTHLAHARARVAAGEVDPRLAEERLGTTLDADLIWEK